MSRPHTLVGTAGAVRVVGVTPMRAAIVDDCADVRFLLATLLELDGRFEVVAEGGHAAAAHAIVAAIDPDVVLVELKSGDESGVSIIRSLRQGGASACIVAMTTSTSSEEHSAAMRAGADAVQEKRSMTSTMVDSLAELVDRHTPAVA